MDKYDKLPRKMMRIQLNKAFFNGFIVALTIWCMIQDAMGLERYIEYCKNHWIQVHVWVWIAILILFIIFHIGRVIYVEKELLKDELRRKKNE